jgi:hypothetical protein
MYQLCITITPGNYGKVIADCVEAIRLDSSNVKAYWRAAKAANALHKHQQAATFAQDGLKVI